MSDGTESTHVAIVHRERVVRSGLESILRADGRFHVLTPVPTLAMLPVRPFDVVVSDIYGVGDAQELSRWLRNSSVVVLTNVDHFAALTAAWVGGACDVLRMEDDAVTIREAVLAADTFIAGNQPVQLGAHVAAALQQSIEHVGASARTVRRDGVRQGTGDLPVAAGLTVSEGLLEVISRMAANGRIDSMLHDPRVLRAFAVADVQTATVQYIKELERFRLECESFGLGVIPHLTLSWGIDEGEELVARPYLSRLSPQQRTIFDLLADGLSGKQAADELHIAERTVLSHIKSAMDKLNMDGRRSAHIVMVTAQLVTGKHPDPGRALELLRQHGFQP